MKKITFRSLIFILFLITWFNTLASYSNNLVITDTLTVTGKIAEAGTGFEKPYLSIRITFKDSTLNQALITDKNGGFKTKILTGQLVRIESDGYIPVNIGIDKLKTDGKKKSLGTIYLQKSINLKEVVITAKAKQEPFKRSYKVTPLKTNEVPIVKYFIKSLPEITMENDMFLVDGNKNTTFYLNGFRSDKNIILNLPLSSIDKVELIQNPTVSRSNDLRAVVINVITKKTSEITIGANTSVSGGAPNKIIGSTFNPYLLHKDLLIAIGINPYTSHSKSSFDTHWYPLRAQQGDSVRETGKNNNKNTPLFLTGFLQKNLTKTLQISADLSYTHTNQEFRQLLKNERFTNNSIPILRMENPFTRRYGSEYYVGTELAYQGKQTNAFLNVSHLNNTLNNYLVDTVRLGQSSVSPITSRQYTHSRDYSIQLSGERYYKVVSGRVGAAYNYRQINSQAANSTNGSALPVLASYKEKNVMLFGSVNLNLKLANISLGIRSDLNRSYNAGGLYAKNSLLSPQLYVSKQLDKAGSFDLNVSRSISTPNQLQVNPSYFVLNQTNRTYGSTFINRETTDKIDISHNISLFKKSPLYFNTNISYSHVENLISSNGYQYNDSSKIFYRQQANIGSYKNFSIYTGLTKRIKSGYMKLGGSVNNYNYKLVDSVAMSKLSFTLRTSLTMNVLKRVTANASFDYTNFNISPYTVVSRGPSVSLNFSGQIIKDRLFAELYWTNIFGWGTVENSTYNSFDVARMSQINQKSQNGSFSLTYIFGKTLNKVASSNRVIEKQDVKRIESN